MIMTQTFQGKDVSSGVVQAVLMHALQLRRGCREVFLLCDVQRCSLAEAALILGISRIAAKRRLQLARQRMQDATETLWANATKQSEGDRRTNRESR